MGITDPSRTTIEDQDIVEAFAHCERLMQRHADHDPLVLALDDPQLRRAVGPAYVFARLGHHFANEPSAVADRLRALSRWEDALQDAFHGRAAHPVFVALGNSARIHGLPITPLMDLIAAFRMDAMRTEFATFEALENYCRLSAGAAARIVLVLSGTSDGRVAASMDHLGVALRLVDIVVDMQRDARRGRVLVPAADLDAFEVSSQDLRSCRCERSRDLVLFMAARARTRLARARALRHQAPTALRSPIAATIARAQQSLDAVQHGAPLP